MLLRSLLANFGFEVSSVKKIVTIYDGVYSMYSQCRLTLLLIPDKLETKTEEFGS